MSYTYNRSITIDHTKVPNADQTNFPVVFTGTYSWLATTGNGGHVQSASGYDIIFASDSAGTTTLSFERVAYSATTGAVEFWIKIPTLSHTSDTTIYVLYGNSAITTDQQSASSVWSNGFKAVYHLSANSALSVADSTGNGNGGVSGNNGKTLPAYTSSTPFGNGGGVFTGGSSIGITLPSMTIASPVTASAWIYPTTTSGSGAMLGGVSFGMMEFRRDLTHIGLVKESIAAMGTSTGSVTVNAWNHAYVTYDGSTATFYLAGASSGATSTSQTFDSGSYLIGGPLPNGENFIGNIDELRISTVVRSADWIAAEYNNQSSPSTFYSIGTESAGGSGSGVSNQPQFFLLM